MAKLHRKGSMNSIKCKLRRIGNSVGVILPAKAVECYNIGDEIVITIETNVITDETNVITQSHNPMMVGYVRP
ncbi:hypothetical protein CL634_06835 [bacterium]|nr:hypothetical protein [bacterium]|tara:strand:+ start:36 stop:254 length:219 start_codon:yes stop_codon:yes gene_type:complete